MIRQIVRDDTPRGLVYSLGYVVEPGTGLIFVGSTERRSDASRGQSFHDQSAASLDFIIDAVARVSDQAKIVKVRRYMTSGRGHRNPATRELWQGRLGRPLPSSTALEVPGSSHLGSLIDLEAWAAVPSDAIASGLHRVYRDEAVPVAVAVPGTAKLVSATAQAAVQGSTRIEFLSCLEQLLAIFSDNGASQRDVVKLTVYFRDPREWVEIEEMIVGALGPNNIPALTGVVTSNMEEPGLGLQISGWAQQTASVDAISRNDNVGLVDLNDSLIVIAGSGAMKIFIGGEAADMYRQDPPATIEEQAHLVMENQGAVLEAAGCTFDDVFRSNWYLTDVRDWDAVKPIVSSYFPRGLPAPLVVETSRLTSKQGVRIEPDLWASKSA